MAKVTTNDRVYDSVQFSRLSEPKCLKIHWASLELLERFGVRLHDPEAIELLKKGGADVA